MTLQDLDFGTWCKNHEDEHESKWCRELYPYNVFRQINFTPDKINIEQKIEFNRVDYFATIKKIELQENGRYRTTFELSTIPASKAQAWKKRTWNASFQIVYTAENKFITVFTKKEDPSKDYVTRFMKGNFEKINLNKSLPISELLFKTLLLHISEENFPGGQHNRKFNVINNGIRNLPEHPQFKRKEFDFFPLYSIDRKIWISYSFNEEKAHRIAFYNANQCEKFLVVFCNPTFTRHHRCIYSDTQIISLFEFSNLLTSDLRLKYEPQIRFLQNHLNIGEQFNVEELKEEIENPKQTEYEIKKSDLMEALGVMKIMPTDKYDTFHSLAAINLINSWLSRNRNKKNISGKDNKLFKNMYYFKTYLADVLTDLIKREVDFAKIYIERDLSIVEIFGFQFSFHHTPKNETISDYEKSNTNKKIIWTGKRLQPIASLLLNYSRTLRNSERTERQTILDNAKS
jgi:hypothetical protein